MLHEPPLHVVAAVLRDRRGRILLARRTGQRELAGLWEFPGGKVEPGESADAALARELHEELGIQLAANVAQPLICVAHHMPSGKRIRLDVHEVPHFHGRARGMEAQAITWVKPAQLCNYSMPEADLPAVAALTQPASYVDVAIGEGFHVRRQDDFDALQGRDGSRLRLLLADASPASMIMLEEVSAWARQYAVDVLLDTAALGLESALKVAHRLEFGLHLSEQDLWRLPDTGLGCMAIGAASCGRAASLQRAQQLGLDFALIALADADAATVEALREVTSLPLYVPGVGMGPKASLAQARRHGAQGLHLPVGCVPGP